ncbi:MAG: kelch repeat-containing protein [Candidatus Nanopelagicales bacterium]
MTANADWFLDPLDRHEYRYWDGRQWTHHVSDGGQASVDPVGGPAVEVASGPWSRVLATKAAARRSHTATLLADGTVLVVGGSDGYGDDINVMDTLNSAVTYDPVTGAWTDAGRMATGRKHHAATLLADGRVLVSGGLGGAFFGRNFERLPSTEADNPAREGWWQYELANLTSAELYDPASRTWQPAGSMRMARSRAAALLNDGRVLVCGGREKSTATDNHGGSDWEWISLVSAEIYDPESGTWSDTGSLHTGIDSPHMILLADGRVLVVDGGLTSAEVYEPESGTWSSTGSMCSKRGRYTMTSLGDGRVLVAGGVPRPRVPPPAGSEEPASAEIYDPESGTWSVTPAMTGSRSDHTATLLTDGSVLMTGGLDFSAPGKVIPIHDSSELYDPGTGTWTAVAPMKEQRYGHTATRLTDGRVLVVGGILREQDPDGRRAAEMFDPAGVCEPPSNAVSSSISRAGEVQETATAPEVRDMSDSQALPATVDVPNPWGLGDGEPFVLPLHPAMSEVFAQTEKAERYKIFFSYLYHPDPAVRLATLVEGKQLKIYLGENQAVVDKLADSSPAVRTAAAQLMWDSPTAIEFALRCLGDEINRTGWTSTMTPQQGLAALDLLRQIAPTGTGDAFEEAIAEIVGGEHRR